MAKVRLIICDVDGVLCKNKTYDKDHNIISKEFKDLDFTAIKAFDRLGVPVILISSDIWNERMAVERGIPFLCSREKDGSINKEKYIPVIEQTYGIPRTEMAYVGDDGTDIPMMKSVGFAFCPADAASYLETEIPNLIRGITKGGEGILSELLHAYMEWENRRFPGVYH